MTLTLSNPSQMFKVGDLKNCVKLKGKHLRCGLFLIELQCSFLQLCWRETPTNRYLVNFAQLLKALFKEHLWVAASASSKVLQYFRYWLISTNLRSFFLCNPSFFANKKNTYVLFSLLKVVESSLKGDVMSK